MDLENIRCMKKPISNFSIRLICLALLCLFSASFITLQASNPLSVDWAAFNYEQNLSLVEIYYALPYNVFHYASVHDTISARYKRIFMLKSLNGNDSLVDSSYHRAIIPSFQKAQSQDMKLLDGFGVFTRAGDYHFNLTIQESTMTYTVIDTITVPDFSRNPDLSDIELASTAIADSSGGKFTKGKMRIIPNPDLKFGQSYELIYIYVEGYNLIPDNTSYQFAYRIRSSDDSLIKSYPVETKVKTGSDFAYTFALSTQGLAAGDYILELILTDLSSNKSVNRTKRFSVLPKVTAPVTGLNYNEPSDTSVFYGEIRFYATPTEQNQYQTLNAEGKKEFLRRFWLRHDFEEFVKRITASDAKYTMGKMLGRDTDRGRIFIKYGAPEEVVVHSVIEHVKPHEHWYYYNKGIHFIFTDIRSNNNYQLIYSNTDSEPKNPNWEKYVDPMEIDELN